MKKIEGMALPISCIANLCYLPEDINRGKQEKTIYEATTLSLPIETIEAKFSFTKASDFSWLYIQYTNDNADVLRTNYRAFLHERFAIIKKRFLDTVCYE